MLVKNETNIVMVGYSFVFSYDIILEDSNVNLLRKLYKVAVCSFFFCLSNCLSKKLPSSREEETRAKRPRSLPEVTGKMPANPVTKFVAHLKICEMGGHYVKYSNHSKINLN